MTDLENAIELLEQNPYKNNYTQEALKYLKIINAQDKVPDKLLEPVLAEITRIGELGQSTWYEVVYYDTDNNEYCHFEGSDTFDCLGDKVLRWKYCKEVFNND